IQTTLIRKSRPITLHQGAVPHFPHHRRGFRSQQSLKWPVSQNAIPATVTFSFLYVPVNGLFHLF
ncbi:MAG: hypothetical protein IKN57_11125, partial [Parasporobacterium sp.]|nr:hypothetical protein [Parasporobacterium sp.]